MESEATYMNLQELSCHCQELESYGGFNIGTIVQFRNGDTGTWKTGKVVYMAIPPWQREPDIAVEMPFDGECQKTWDGCWDGRRFFTPKPGVNTVLVPVGDAIPEELVAGNGQDVANQPKELTKVGELEKGMTVRFEVGDTWRSGKVVYMTVPPERSEPYIAVEMPFGDGSKKTWDGNWGKTHIFSPRPDVATYFFPANSAIPGHLMALDEAQGNEAYALDTARPQPPIQLTEVSVDGSNNIVNAFNGPTTVHIYPKKTSSGEACGSSSSQDTITGAAPSTEEQMHGETDNLQRDVIDAVIKIIHKDWRKIGELLHLDRKDIERIDKQESTEKQRTLKMLHTWQKRGPGLDKISRLATACRKRDFAKLADKLEQGLNEDLMNKISKSVPRIQWRQLGELLEFQATELDDMKCGFCSIPQRVRMMLAKWKTRQSYNEDKIKLLSNALSRIGLRQLSLEVTKGCGSYAQMRAFESLRSWNSDCMNDDVHGDQRTSPLESLSFEELQTTLTDSINPVQHGLAGASSGPQPREHLGHPNTAKGLTNEELFHSLQSEVMSRPPLRIRHRDSKAVDESKIYQISLHECEPSAFPSVEQLLLKSFLERNLKLAEMPSTMTVQTVRFDKDKQYNQRVVPSLQLNVSNILEGYPRQCLVCGVLAVLECKSCEPDETVAEATPIKNFCRECFNTMHQKRERSSHQPTKLCIPEPIQKEFYSKSTADGFTEEEVDSHHAAMLAPKLMDLFAVICLHRGHSVAFVKAGKELDSKWVLLDSMVDRQGEQQGFHTPQIKHIKDFRSWTNEDFIKSRLRSNGLPDLMECLLGNAHTYVYSN